MSSSSVIKISYGLVVFSFDALNLLVIFLIIRVLYRFLVQFSSIWQHIEKLVENVLRVQWVSVIQTSSSVASWWQSLVMGNHIEHSVFGDVQIVEGNVPNYLWTLGFGTFSNICESWKGFGGSAQDEHD